MEKVTIKDIAKALNVSVSTVSKALSDSYEISGETKQKILAFAEKHHYVANHHARNLKAGKTNSVGVIVCNMANTFVSQVLASIQNNLEEQRIDTLIMQSHYDERQERRCLENMNYHGVDGILISPVRPDSNLDLLQEFQKQHPLVLFDRTQSILKTHKVGIDNLGGGYKATRYLLNSGKRNVAIVLAEGLGISAGRLSGYSKALSEYGIAEKKENIFYIPLGDNEKLDDGVLTFVKKRLQADPPIDSVILASETISTRGIGIFAEAGIRVPQDLSVIGFANTSLAFAFNPPLTTILQPAEMMGQLAVEKMMELLNKPNVFQFENIKLETELVIRKSCD